MKDENGNVNQVTKIGDIGYVENSNFLICNYEDGDKLGGTIAEITIAWYRGIPVYLITSAPKSKINKSVLFFILDSGTEQGRIFENQTQLLEFLDKKYKLKIKKTKENSEVK